MQRPLTPPYPANEPCWKCRARQPQIWFSGMFYVRLSPKSAAAQAKATAKPILRMAGGILHTSSDCTGKAGSPTAAGWWLSHPSASCCHCAVPSVFWARKCDTGATRDMISALARHCSVSRLPWALSSPGHSSPGAAVSQAGEHVLLWCSFSSAHSARSSFWVGWSPVAAPLLGQSAGTAQGQRPAWAQVTAGSLSFIGYRQFWRQQNPQKNCTTGKQEDKKEPVGRLWGENL